MRSRYFHALAITGVIAMAGCGSNGSSGETSESTASTGANGSVVESDLPAEMVVVAGEPFPEARCEANQAAGTITYLTGFDFAAAASIVDVIVAEASGYYDDMCLSVDVRSSFSVGNYPLIADDTAQFASGGSFSEVVSFATANDADFVVTAVEGRTAIETLLVKTGAATELADLAGSTIGVKGKLPPSIEVMLLNAGLAEGADFDTVLLDGFDPTQHIEIPTIVGFPGYKSNEPGILERAGVGFQTFDPLDSNIPGSFGVIYTNRAFVTEHPTAAVDFMRATMQGLAAAIADPEGSATTAVEKVNANGNPNFLSADGEVFRWETDAQLIIDTTPEGTAFGIPDSAALQSELEAYAAVDLFGEGDVPDAAGYLANEILGSVYDENQELIWPA